MFLGGEDRPKIQLHRTTVIFPTFLIQIAAREKVAWRSIPFTQLGQAISKCESDYLDYSAAQNA